ncbi:MAG: cyclic-phosphate processing receiver domain-containing protein [Patescibacteria group bacterium]|jgi:hypothetical protein
MLLETRGCPKGWTWAKDVESVIEIIESSEVVEMSLDCDIEHNKWNGYGEPLTLQGTDLVKWIVNNLPPAKWPHTIRIHSRNMGDGIKNMESTLKDYKPFFTEIIVKMYVPEMIEELSDRTARELIDEAKVAGQDSFGLVNDPEAVAILDELAAKDESKS